MIILPASVAKLRILFRVAIGLDAKLQDTRPCPEHISPYAGTLGGLHVECTRCSRNGRYSVAKLIAKHGRRGNMSKWVSDPRVDCPKRNAPQLHERRDLICPDLLPASFHKAKTRQRHWLCTAAMVLMPGLRPIKVLV
jgi:hypothetical protein